MIEHLTRFEVAHLNIDVGTVTSPAGAVEPTPYNLFSGDWLTARNSID